MADRDDSTAGEHLGDDAPDAAADDESDRAEVAPSRRTKISRRSKKDGEESADDIPKKSGAKSAKKRASDKDDNKTKKSSDKKSRNPIAFVGRFLREVIAELRKVIWPTRKELVTFSAVVIVFVAVMVAVIGALDYGLAKAVFAVFAGSAA